MAHHVTDACQDKESTGEGIVLREHEVAQGRREGNSHQRDQIWNSQNVLLHREEMTRDLSCVLDHSALQMTYHCQWREQIQENKLTHHTHHLLKSIVLAIR